MSKTILYVDDEAALPGGFAATAETLGYRVAEARGAGEALAALRELQPEVVIVEPLVPGAWELLRRVVDERRGVIVYTRDQRTPEVYGRALDLGVSEFVCKPALRADLLDCLLAIESRCAAPLAAGGAAVLAPDLSGADVIEASSLIEAIAKLRGHAATGVLWVIQAGDSLAIELRNGSIVARSSAGEEALEDFAVRTGRITAKQRARLDEFTRDGTSAYRALIDHEFMDEAEAQAALRERAEEHLWAALEWGAAAYQFCANTALDPRKSLEIERDTASILYEAVQKAPDGRAFSAWLRSNRTRIVVPVVDRRGRFAGRFEKEDGRALLEAINAERRISEILASGEIGERALYGLLVAGWADFIEEIETFEPLEENLPVSASAPVAPEPVRQHQDPAPLHTGAVVPASANQAKRESDPERALEAEEWFRRGRAFLESKRHREASEAFGMAAHLDPSEGEYAAHLGYAMYLANVGDGVIEREAMEHIARGIKQSPERDLPYVFLGRIFKAKGDLEMARKMFRRAIRIRPDCHPARQELRLIEIRGAKQKASKGSLLGRLLDK